MKIIENNKLKKYHKLGIILTPMYLQVVLISIMIVLINLKFLQKMIIHFGPKLLIKNKVSLIPKSIQH